jgi:HlyD family secretion protein
LLGAWGGWSTRDEERYRVASVTRGDVLSSVTANGVVNPVGVISVGTQVSGTIERIHVDYNSKIERGQLLAEIDPAVYQAAVRQSRANLLSAQASLSLAAQKEKRALQLFAAKLAAQQDVDQAVQNRVAAAAQVAVAEAQLSRDVSNLGYTKIFAPVAGIVLSREVALGQTVAASFQTPTLFKIAEDLGRMQIECSVPEADIGGIAVGQRVTFSVEAFRSETFAGTVREIRLSPKVEQGIVSYSVMVEVQNSDGKLMPGMTALVAIVVGERRNVLRVPSAALAFRPSSGLPKDVAGFGSTVFVLSDGRLRAVAVVAGLSNGELTEIAGDSIVAGTRIVLAEAGRESTPGG